MRRTTKARPTSPQRSSGTPMTAVWRDWRVALCPSPVPPDVQEAADARGYTLRAWDGASLPSDLSALLKG